MFVHLIAAAVFTKASSPVVSAILAPSVAFLGKALRCPATWDDALGAARVLVGRPVTATGEEVLVISLAGNARFARAPPPLMLLTTTATGIVESVLDWRVDHGRERRTSLMRRQRRCGRSLRPSVLTIPTTMFAGPGATLGRRGRRVRSRLPLTSMFVVPAETVILSGMRLSGAGGEGEREGGADHGFHYAAPSPVEGCSELLQSLRHAT